MSKHTPGPWGNSSEKFRIIKKYDALGETHVMIGSAMGGSTSGSYFIEDDEEVAANARLIAAAPDLLEALVLCEESLILVANNCNRSISEGLRKQSDDRLLECIKVSRSAIAKALGEV